MFTRKRTGALYAVLSCIISICSVILGAVIYTKANESVTVSAVISCSVLIVLQAFLYFCMRFFKRKSTQNAIEARTALGEGAFGVISNIAIPTVISRLDRRVLWYNGSFAEIASTLGLRNIKNLSEVVDYSPEEIMSEQNGIEISLGESHFLLRAYNVNSTASSKAMIAVTFESIDEQIELRTRLHEESTLVAYIAIDNLDELYQYVQEKFTTASGEVAGILNKWAQEAGGVLIEYSKDKFIFLFEASKLPGFIENKFDILDRVRNINVGDAGLPVTVSIGIAGDGKTLSEKEKTARSALDTALQRGGDQVVVKSTDGVEYYGARIQTAQKLTKVRARVFSTKLAEMIALADNVLVMAHVRPDFDAIGAMLGIARLSHYCGTKVNIITDFTSEDMLKCIDKVSSVPEYRDTGIFIDSCQAQDKICGGTLLIVVDVNNPSHIESPNILNNAPYVVYIDHHRKSGDLEGDNVSVYIEPATSSSCELVCEILEYSMNPGSLSREEADIMLAGIMLDTKQFIRNTGSRTFGAALFLRREGATSTAAQELFKTALEDLTREAAYEKNAVLYRNSIAISHSFSGENPAIDRIAAAKAADKLLDAKGIDASFVLCAMSDTVHISARSAGKINVQLILEKLGGGGHFESAATQLKGVTSEQAVKLLKNAIDDYLNNNTEWKEK